MTAAANAASAQPETEPAGVVVLPSGGGRPLAAGQPSVEQRLRQRRLSGQQVAHDLTKLGSLPEVRPLRGVQQVTECLGRRGPLP